MMATMSRKAPAHEQALETILEYVEDIKVSPARLSRALLLLDTDAELLTAHEQRLLDDAWAKVKDDAARRRWEEMGR